MYLTPPLTPPFPNSGVKYIDELIDLSSVASPEVSDDTTDKSFDELTDDSTNGSVKSFDQLIDNLWFLLRMMLDGVEKRMGITGTSTTTGKMLNNFFAVPSLPQEKPS
jgi:hypothetical protein